MNIVAPFLEIVRKHENAVAFHAARSSWRNAVTFRELSETSSRIAAQLLDSGLKQENTAILLIPVTPELYAVLLALFRIGMVAVVLDPSAGAAHIRHCLEIIPPDAFIGIPKAHFLRLRHMRLLRISKTFSLGGWFPFSKRLILDTTPGGKEVLRDLEFAAPALITFTSGSTGQPKATVRTHQFLMDQHRVLERNIHLRARQVDLTTLAIFGLANLASGLTSVLPDCDLRRVGEIEPKPVLKQMNAHQITRLASSPAFLQRLLEHPEAAALGASLSEIYTGGAPVFPTLLQRARQIWPLCEPTAVYGSTEAEPIAHAAWSEFAPEDLVAMNEGNGLLAGKPVPEIQVAILQQNWGTPIGPFGKQEFRNQQLRAGKVGEIVVSGDHVLKSYHQGRGDEETKFRVDEVVWHRTGDMGKWDEQGRLWLQGRCSSWIRDGRGEISPFAVECVAMNQDWVKQAGCFSWRDRRVLAVAAKTSNSEEKIAALKRQLSWALVDEIMVVEALPVDKRHNAKIDYDELRRMWEKAQAASG